MQKNRKSLDQDIYIYQNGEIIKTLNLASSGDITLEILGENGEKNIIQIENHDVFMFEANCPDKLCVKQGKLSENVVPIVCLPNKIVITRLSGNSPYNSAEEYDAFSY